jgi:hypothetical protein
MDEMEDNDRRGHNGGSLAPSLHPAQTLKWPILFESFRPPYLPLLDTLGYWILEYWILTPYSRRSSGRSQAGPNPISFFLLVGKEAYLLQPLTRIN